MELGKFAKTKLGDQTWREVVQLAGIPPPLCPGGRLPGRGICQSPDGPFGQAGRIHPGNPGEPRRIHRARSFIQTFQYLINPDWKTIDLIAHTEETIHEVLRRAGTKTNPPQLKCWQPGPREVVVIYTSPRKLCALAKGIVRGIVRHYGERITIQEPSCMLKGGAECELIITLA